ncbi:CDP-glucose 4,6-dehydratase [Malaciobacter molluscorum LMG 25693]|uniref:CDP-glucose 4,6-dehydratase n=1 Tax=Malaciobacter molluscorum LMG 25693 TaxID=870501 RepID=A0A2G1DKA0_9BACT|nr:CDP-glucose 4,6-dehydratase [Malaciobacter molluscorum]AXX92903.1 CDP-glucose 4,6-dehydratase, putative [Malaciobacter molluscorum LMG 25693]PHO18736.1 CDP-glucose 4,6-dehydratase [Malaciobacter molluscorum LMG 25693]RXJ96212.1 CDP-glucose 4,6-dehydratase [Malaciobacter molluscorum]
MEKLFNSIYKNRTVLVTGHTGFKGSWLCYWLKKMGANVIGYSLEVPTNPNHFELLDLDIVSIIGDICDIDKLNKTFTKYKPDIVFHLAAQALVRLSYEMPIETYETNVIGTLKVFEACRNHDVKAIVNITSDKAYENKEWIWGYRENDPMGGYDPYSSSKACADILTSSYRNSYFNINDYKTKHNTLLATCRAGNVIGGGDWAKDRLITDIMISVSKGNKVSIRNPYATRPWQHVLEPLSGYLMIGQKLLEEYKEFADAWNFGPSDEGSISVKEVVENVKKYWTKIDYEINKDTNNLHEANLLKLDCSKAHISLKWNDVWNSEKTFEKTVLWYKSFYENDYLLTDDDLLSYVADAKKKNLVWSK